MRNLKENNKKYYIYAIICILSAVLYRLLPIDLLPDFIEEIGKADDLIFAIIGLIAAVVNFFTGLGLGVRLTGRAEDRLKWQDSFDKTYGTFFQSGDF